MRYAMGCHRKPWTFDASDREMEQIIIGLGGYSGDGRGSAAGLLALR